MTLPRYLRTCLLLCGLAVALCPLAGRAQPPSGATLPQPPAVPDGQHDFDFEFGAWTAHISRLQHPLTGSTSWVEYEGTSTVRKVWDGRANLGELEVDGPAGHLEGLSLRLYNPQTRQWAISWANGNDGSLGDRAMIGGFKSGSGEFYDQEPLNGRAIFVRFIFSDITPTAFRLEQAFSDDGGKSWEVNWIAKFTR
jgi:hypothetical protein